MFFEAWRKRMTSLFLESEVLFKDSTTQSKLLAFSWWIQAVKTGLRMGLKGWVSLHCYGRLRWDTPAPSDHFLIFTDQNHRWETLWKEVLYPRKFFSFAVFSYWKFQGNTKAERIIYWTSLCIHHIKCDLNSKVMAALGSTEHPSTSPDWPQKIPYIILLICKYL